MLTCVHKAVNNENLVKRNINNGIYYGSLFVDKPTNDMCSDSLLFDYIYLR